jgi:hypothetical protein
MSVTLLRNQGIKARLSPVVINTKLLIRLGEKDYF